MKAMPYGWAPGVGANESGIVAIELRYPRTEGACHTLEIGLEDVRAADPIRVRYDFDRDGWLIEQEKQVEMDPTTGGVTLGTNRWVEVAFVQAWGETLAVDEADPKDVETATQLAGWEYL